AFIGLPCPRNTAGIAVAPMETPYHTSPRQAGARTGLRSTSRVRGTLPFNGALSASATGGPRCGGCPVLSLRQGAPRPRDGPSGRALRARAVTQSVREALVPRRNGRRPDRGAGRCVLGSRQPRSGLRARWLGRRAAPPPHRVRSAPAQAPGRLLRRRRSAL